MAIHLDTKINKGAIEFKSRDFDLDRIPFLTKGQRKSGVYHYFIHNNYGVKFYKQNEEWFNKAGVFLDIEYNDYTQRHEPRERKDLPGITLESYQERVLEYMLSCKYMMFPFGPGSGKTFMALTYINSRGTGNYLVLTPNKVIGQYKTEAENFVLGANVVVLKKPEQLQEDGFNIYITNYEKMVKIPRDFWFDAILFDESHRLKSFTSGLNEQACRLSRQAGEVFMFTGTPMQASRDEIFAQLKVMQPQLVPTKGHFMERYYYLNEYFKPEGEKRPGELEEIITRMTYGEETKNIVDLPPAIHYEIACKFKDKKYYNRMHNHSLIMLGDQLQLIIDIDEAIDSGAKITSADSSAVRYAKERQIASGFIYTDDNEVIRLPENPKREAFLELINRTNTAIIYTRLKAERDDVHMMLLELDRSHVLVDGSTSQKDSDEFINKFKTGQVDFLVIQIRSGSAGLHLVNTDTTIYYSLPDSSIDYEQSTYRIRRRGQEKTCHFYSFIVKGTAERKNYNDLKRKIEDSQNQFKIYRREV